MTNINCSSNCKHQADGKCTLDTATVSSLSAEAGCAFFDEKAPKTESRNESARMPHLRMN